MRRRRRRRKRRRKGGRWRVGGLWAMGTFDIRLTDSRWRPMATWRLGLGKCCGLVSIGCLPPTSWEVQLSRLALSAWMVVWVDVRFRTGWMRLWKLSSSTM